MPALIEPPRSIGLHLRQGSDHVAAVDAVDHLDPGRSVEHEGEVVRGLLVPGHERRAAARGRPWPGSSADRSKADHHPAVALDPLVVDAAEAAGQEGGEDQADGHRLAVAEAGPRASSPKAGGLQGVGQGVAVVEHHPPVPLALVGRHHVGLDGDAAGHLLVERQLEQRRTDDRSPRRVGPSKAYLAISPRPEAHSRGGRVASTSVSHSTALGCQKAPTRFFPSGRFTPGLATDGRVDLGQQGGGHVDVGHAPVERRRRRSRPGR